MTQNKLDGPQSGKLCKTFKLTKRESEGKMARQTKMKRERLIRQSLGGHGNAQKKAHMGKEGSGCGLDSEGPAHAL